MLTHIYNIYKCMYITHTLFYVYIYIYNVHAYIKAHSCGCRKPILQGVFQRNKNCVKSSSFFNTKLFRRLMWGIISTVYGLRAILAPCMGNINNMYGLRSVIVSQTLICRNLHHVWVTLRDSQPNLNMSNLKITMDDYSHYIHMII